MQRALQITSLKAIVWVDRVSKMTKMNITENQRANKVDHRT